MQIILVLIMKTKKGSFIELVELEIEVNDLNRE